MKRLLIALLLLSAITAIFACNEEDIEYKRAYSVGAVIYQDHCQNCHGTNGEGLSNLMPPLTDSVFLNKNSHLLPCVIINGSEQMLLVHGKPYTNKMPPSGLAPIEVSQVLTYVRNSFGNKHGMVTLNEVSKDLQQCP